MEFSTKQFAQLRSVLASFLITAIAGCASIAPGVPSVSGYRLTDQELDLLSKRLNSRERPNLGLAMSGGGLRSSLFNFGVLKALYDDGLLKEVDVVSSVSGGSYLSYYLYTMQLQEPGKPFGAAVFDDKVFAERTCDLVRNANFVTYGNIAGAAAQWPVYGNSAFTWMYEAQIRTTYGKETSLTSLAPLVREGQAPYLIINSTIYGKRLKKAPWYARTFEITPLAHGNFEFGFKLWNDHSAPVPEDSLLLATAASGAAKSPLRRTFSAPFRGSKPTDMVELWDGGKTENLGAAALLLRGAGQVIVVDAQYDGKGNAFEAYHTLQRRMENLGVGVTLDKRPQFVATDVYPGKASGRSIESSLYYVKMGISPAFRDAVYSAEGDKRLHSASSANKEFWRLGRPERGNWQCSQLSGFSTNYREWLFYQAGSYLRFSERAGLKSWLVRSDPWLVGDVVNHSFPRTTTADQSFYPDQALAFIGLGYVTAKDSVATLIRDRPAANAVQDASGAPH